MNNDEIAKEYIKKSFLDNSINYINYLQNYNNKNALDKDFLELDISHSNLDIQMKNNEKYEDFYTFLKSINFYFDETKPLSFLANANNQTHSVTFSSYNITKARLTTIVHEVSHLLLFWFSKGVIIGHTLEFAIVTYCLHYHYSDKQHKTCFFQSYDIHEDKAFSLLSINTCKFDELIRNIQFNNVEELYHKAVLYADKIRQNTIKF